MPLNFKNGGGRVAGVRAICEQTVKLSCFRRVWRESPDVGAGLKPAPTGAIIFGGGQFFGHERLAQAGAGQTPMPLNMIRVAGLDGHGPIELLQEHEAAQFVGQGEAGQGQAFGGGGHRLLVQAPVTANDEGEGPGFQFPPGEPGGEFFRSKFPALGGEGGNKGPGRNLDPETLAFLTLMAAAVRPPASFSSRTLLSVRCRKGCNRLT